MEDQIKDLITEPLMKEGIYVDKVLYEVEGNNNFLRIIIDKEPVVDIDACVLATNLINPILDQTNLIDNAYILDVSSKERGGYDGK